MLRLAKHYSQQSRKFGVCTETEGIREVLAISGFERIIKIFDTEPRRYPNLALANIPT